MLAQMRFGAILIFGNVRAFESNRGAEFVQAAAETDCSHFIDRNDGGFGVRIERKSLGPTWFSGSHPWATGRPF